MGGSNGCYKPTQRSSPGKYPGFFVSKGLFQKQINDIIRNFREPNPRIVEQKPPKNKKTVFLIISVAVLGLTFYFLFFEDGRIKRPGYDSKKLEQTQKKDDVTLNQYLELYAGTYEIKLREYAGTDTEVYHLYATGEADYIWTFGARSTKENGTWSASHQQIIVTLKGNSDDIIKTFVREGAYFTLTNDSNRYLVKQ